RPLPLSRLFPYTTLFRSLAESGVRDARFRVYGNEMIPRCNDQQALVRSVGPIGEATTGELARRFLPADSLVHFPLPERLARGRRSEEHTSELQSLRHLVC